MDPKLHNINEFFFSRPVDRQTKKVCHKVYRSSIFPQGWSKAMSSDTLNIIAEKHDSQIHLRLTHTGKCYIANLRCWEA